MKNTTNHNDNLNETTVEEFEYNEQTPLLAKSSSSSFSSSSSSSVTSIQAQQQQQQQPTTEITPLPISKCVVLSIILFCNQIINTSILPFLAFMIADFGYTDLEIGTYSGYLLSSFMVGQLCFSYVWGYLSDKYGRRPILLLGLLLTSISILFFGFSSSFIMAITIRFICGCVNGIMGVSKTYLAEITDETNQSRGFAILGMNRALGLIVGPVIGGYLSSPSEKYPSLFPKNSFFDVYPYALPTIIAFLLSCLGTIAAYFVLEETLKPKVPEIVVIQSQEYHSNSGDEVYKSTSSSSSTTSTTPRSSIDDDEVYAASESSTLLISDIEAAKVEKKPISLSPWSLLQDQRIFISILMYGCVQVYNVVYDSSFVLWARLPQDEGGIGWDSSQIGTAFSVGGIALLLFQGFVYHRIERRFGPLNAYKMGVLVIIPAYVIIPRAGYFLGPSLGDARDFNGGTWVVWVLVLFCQALRSVSSIQASTSCFILIANSSLPQTRGAVNGIGQTVGSLCNVLGPIMGGWLFSLGMSYYEVFGGASLVFNLLVLMGLISFGASQFAPYSINQRRVE